MNKRLQFLLLCLLESVVQIEGPSNACVESLKSRSSCGGSTTCERLQCSIRAQSGCSASELGEMGLNPSTNINMYEKYCNKPQGPAFKSSSLQSKPGESSYSSSASSYKSSSGSSYQPGSYGSSSYQPISSSSSSSYSSSRYKPSSYSSSSSYSSKYKPGSSSSYSSSSYRPSSSSSSRYKSGSRLSSSNKY